MRPTEDNLRKNAWRSYSERQALEGMTNEELFAINSHMFLKKNNGEILV